METFHLTPFLPEETGLPNRVWVATYAPGVSEGLVQDPDKPYFLYELFEGEMTYAKVVIFPEIEIEELEEMFDQNQIEPLKKWIQLNLETLLAHWRGEIDSLDLARRLEKVQ